MKKDRLDKMLTDAFGVEPDEPNLAKAGLSRFRNRVIEGSDAATVLDEALRTSASEPAAPIRDEVTDAGLRRLRNRLAVQRKPVRLPVLRPVLAFASVVTVVLLFVLVNNLISPEAPIADEPPGLFDKALATRGDIIAMLPDSESFRAGSSGGTEIDLATAGRFNRILGHLDSFSTKARGENFARKIDDNRRSIREALSADRNSGSRTSYGGPIVQGETSPAPTRHQIRLVEKLNRAAAGF